MWLINISSSDERIINKSPWSVLLPRSRSHPASGQKNSRIDIFFVCVFIVIAGGESISTTTVGEDGRIEVWSRRDGVYQSGKQSACYLPSLATKSFYPDRRSSTCYCTIFFVLGLTDSEVTNCLLQTGMAGDDLIPLTQFSTDESSETGMVRRRFSVEIPDDTNCRGGIDQNACMIRCVNNVGTPLCRLFTKMYKN